MLYKNLTCSQVEWWQTLHRKRRYSLYRLTAQSWECAVKDNYPPGNDHIIIPYPLALFSRIFSGFPNVGYVSFLEGSGFNWRIRAVDMLWITFFQSSALYCNWGILLWCPQFWHVLVRYQCLFMFGHNMQAYARFTIILPRIFFYHNPCAKTCRTEPRRPWSLWEWVPTQIACWNWWWRMA